MRALLGRQMRNWAACREGFASLEHVRQRRFEIDGVRVVAQCNPRRAASSTAKVDADSLRARKCFLCPENLPPEQESLAWNARMHVLVNPFPILPEHFTIPHLAHLPQNLASYLGDFLELVQGVGNELLVLYNGPTSGASAPDHHHFQACSRGHLPAEVGLDAALQSAGQVVVGSSDGSIRALDGSFLRCAFVIDSGSVSWIHAALGAVVRALQGLANRDAGTEPPINLLGWREGAELRCLLFPRGRHRPACYDAPEPHRLVISPGAIDMAGLLVTPFEQTLDRLDESAIRQILRDVTLPPDAFSEALTRLRHA
jgi:hypothetical protein